MTKKFNLAYRGHPVLQNRILVLYLVSVCLSFTAESMQPLNRYLYEAIHCYFNANIYQLLIAVRVIVCNSPWFFFFKLYPVFGFFSSIFTFSSFPFYLPPLILK